MRYNSDTLTSHLTSLFQLSLSRFHWKLKLICLLFLFILSYFLAIRTDTPVFDLALILSFRTSFFLIQLIDFQLEDQDHLLQCL
jgi:hypothetical protein